MKRKVLLLTAFTVAFTYICGGSVATAKTSSSAQASSAAPEITAEAAIVADADSGYIYYQKNMHKKMYPASITKILTGIVAVENGNDSDVITVTKDAVKGITSDYANVALTPGEQITQEEALYTMFLASANDSANAVAYHIGGTMDNFVSMMNKRAKELGAVDSHFSNPSGMPDEKNVTSAYDMALITKKALHEPKVMKYFGATSYTMPPTNVRTESVVYRTLHKMMKNTVYKYDGVIAGKTGYESMSGHTMVTVAKRDGRTLICVVLKSSTGRTVYKDTIALLDYTFSLPAVGYAQDLESTENYLQVPSIMGALKSSALPSITAKPEVTSSQRQDAALSTAKTTNENRTFPVLLIPLALIVCLLTFVVSCRVISKRTRRARRNAVTASAAIVDVFSAAQRRRYKA